MDFYFYWERLGLSRVSAKPAPETALMVALEPENTAIFGLHQSVEKTTGLLKSFIGTPLDCLTAPRPDLTTNY